MRLLLRGSTATTLLAIGVLHAVWGTGSTFPFSTRDELNDTVIGRRATPSPAACFGVAGLLAVSSALVAGLPAHDSRFRRAGVCVVAVVLGTRAALGFADKTELVSPGSVSLRFRRMDKRVYSPLCVALAIGAASAIRS